MKKILFLSPLLFAGCIVEESHRPRPVVIERREPVYVQPQPVVVQCQPVYVAPPQFVPEPPVVVEEYYFVNGHHWYWHADHARYEIWEGAPLPGCRIHQVVALPRREDVVRIHRDERFTPPSEPVHVEQHRHYGEYKAVTVVNVTNITNISNVSNVRNTVNTVNTTNNVNTVVVHEAPRPRPVVVEEKVVVERQPVYVQPPQFKPEPPVVVEEFFLVNGHHWYWHAGHARYEIWEGAPLPGYRVRTVAVLPRREEVLRGHQNEHFTPPAHEVHAEQHRHYGEYNR